MSFFKNFMNLHVFQILFGSMLLGGMCIWGDLFKYFIFLGYLGLLWKRQKPDEREMYIMYKASRFTLITLLIPIFFAEKVFPNLDTPFVITAFLLILHGLYGLVFYHMTLRHNER